MLTKSQAAAFINGQAALLNAEVAMMQAANQEAGYVRYGEAQFAKVLTQYEGVLGHNAALTLLQTAVYES